MVSIKLVNVVIWKAPVEFESQLSHHKEHEDHEEKIEHIDIPSPCTSCPSWLYVCDLRFLHNRIRQNSGLKSQSVVNNQISILEMVNI